MNKIYMQLAILIFLIVAMPDYISAQKSESDVYHEASFPISEGELKTYLIENTEYPTEAKGLMGEVIVKFKVLENGSVEKIKVKKGLCKSCDETAIKVVSSMPDWNPAIKKGKKYSSKQLLSIKIEPLPEDYLFQKPDVYPIFDAPPFVEFVRNRLKYPEEAIKNRIGGRVKLNFSVLKNGTVEKIEVVDGLGYGCDQEAIRLIKSTSGIWTPAMKFKENVNYSMTGFVYFPIEDYKIRKDYNADHDEEIFEVADIMPEFKGGYIGFVKFLQQNMVYPVLAQEAKIQGKGHVKFVVRKDGTLDSFQVVKGVGGGCDEEALRVLRMSPKWTPGQQKGKAVNVSYIVPINFQLR